MKDIFILDEHGKRIGLKPTNDPLDTVPTAWTRLVPPSALVKKPDGDNQGGQGGIQLI